MISFKPIDILQEGSIIHPASKGKKAGLKWPIFPGHQSLLRQMVPILIECHHAIANYEALFHNTKNNMGFAIAQELTDMVSYL